MTRELKHDSQEAFAEYREKFLRFGSENKRYHNESNFYRGVALPMTIGEPRDEGAREIMDEVSEYYTHKGDNFNLLRYYGKIGSEERMLEMAKHIEEGGSLIERAHAAQQIWKHFKNDLDKQKAIEAYTEIESEYEGQGDNLMAGVYSDALFKITKNEEYREKAIARYLRFAEERKKKGDSWWEAISLREIAKLSKGTENQEETLRVAIDHANKEIQRAEMAGHFREAGLWARDIFKLTGTQESRDRAESLFLSQIEKSRQAFKSSSESNDLRDMAKSFWEMWKVTKKEEHRQEAVERYKQLLQMAKNENNENRKEECYRVLLYLVQ